MGMSAIVLAGGEGKRFGQNKALVNIGNKTLIELVIMRIEDLFDEVMIVGGLVPREILPHLRHIQDMVRCGPIGGIYTGLLNSKTHYNFVFGCDMPLIERGLVHSMMDKVKGYDLIIPKGQRGPEPLHSIYSKGCLPYIEEQISKRDFKISNLLGRIKKTRYLDADWAESSFFNLNTYEDLMWIMKKKGRSLDGKDQDIC